ncbi:hypothetical protein M514_01544 [Trichuris suis]|uniref:Uncharacterized protein n=1 Tax=Trichuris suis TaxID=68888 RepID=A0A085NAQ3_9BILA|nr:hypothetical protein M513_01544 [Trichuris suis]KFD66549.1 hypothetical protein M514_01544 [Trichuris suis]
MLANGTGVGTRQGTPRAAVDNCKGTNGKSIRFIEEYECLRLQARAARSQAVMKSQKTSLKLPALLTKAVLLSRVVLRRAQVKAKYLSKCRVKMNRLQIKKRAQRRVSRNNLRRKKLVPAGRKKKMKMKHPVRKAE